MATFMGLLESKAKTCLAKRPADSIVHASPLSRYAKGPAITLGTDF